MLALGLFFSARRRAPRTSAVVVADAEAGLAQNICSPSRGEKIFDYAGEKADPVGENEAPFSSESKVPNRTLLFPEEDAAQLGDVHPMEPPVGEVKESVSSACKETALPGPEEEVEAPRRAGDVQLAEEEEKQEEWHEAP